MEKIKIHELAKKLNKSSKEIMEMASRLGIKIKSHLSLVEGKDANKIEQEMSKTNQNSKEKTKPEKANNTPVIIRREVIISDEELARKEEEKKEKEQTARKDVGFIERKKNQEYNIVYRDKPSKPMTASELFGLKAKPKQESKPEEKVQTPSKEEPKAEIRPEAKLEVKQEVKQEIKEEPKPEEKQYNTKNNQNTINKRPENHNYGNKPKFDNNKKNFGNNKPVNHFNKNDRNDRNNGGFKNQNQNQNRKNFSGGNNSDYRNNRKLDERGIEKNIKNIMAQELGEKDSTREYNRNMIKQKSNNKNQSDETRQRKNSKSSRGEEFDTGKLRNLKQENKLSNMFSDPEGRNI